jgi:flagellar hook-associated protein 2
MAPVAQFSGLASGIDSKSLIDALIEAKLRTNELRKEEISFLESENDALEELNTKLLSLSELVDKFRSANGGGVSKKASSTDASVVTAAVSPAAANASIGITVASVASAATGSFSDSYTDGSDLFAANAVGTQTITVQVGTGASQVSIDVNITSATTASEFIDSFNNDADASGRAIASLVKVADNDYRVVISTLKTGLNEGQIGFVIPSAAAGFGGNSDLQTRTIDQATNAQFSIDGIAGTITRQSNSVSDVLTGVTFQLSKTGTASIVVGDDSDATADSFQEIVDAFNDLVEYISENNTKTQDTQSRDGNMIYGTLAKSRLDDDFLSQFRETLLGAISSGTGAVQSAADLGISTNRDGTISFDVEKFKTAVSSDSTGATDVLQSFADETGGVDGFLYQYTTFQGFIDLAQTSNLSEIDSLNEKIEQLQRSADKTRDRLVLQFSRLESITAQMQQKQSELSSVLAGLQ